MQLQLKKKSLVTFNNRLIFGRKKISGRNNTGKIVTFYRGKGKKRVYRVVDFNRYIWNVKGVLFSIEYDPNRTGMLSLLTYANGVASFIISITNLPISSVITATDVIKEGVEDKIGFCSFFKFIKPGSYVHNVELKKNKGAKLVRAASGYSKLVSITKDNFAIVKLRSKFLLKIPSTCIATIGFILSWASLFAKRNAGLSRRLGRRPHVRGVAKNPVDHPHGGGQGKTSGGRPSVTPWSYITKGRRTRRHKTYGTFVLKR